MNISESQIIYFSKMFSFLFLVGTQTHTGMQHGHYTGVDFNLVNTLLAGIWKLYLCLLDIIYLSLLFMQPTDFTTELVYIYILLFLALLFFPIKSYLLQFSGHWILLLVLNRIFRTPTSLAGSVLLLVIAHLSHFRAYFLHLPEDWPYLMNALHGSRGFKSLSLSLSFPYQLLLSLNFSVI